MGANSSHLQEIKNKHSDLYYGMVTLLQAMKNGGGILQWILNIYGDDKKYLQNIKKALYHINIAIDILQGTMYKE